jgi:hypothetical protein
MSSRNLASGSSILGRYGGGGDANRPERLRWLILYNNSGSTMFIPENTAAERVSVYNNFPNKESLDPAYGVTANRKLYNNTATLGNGPCWNNNSNSANYLTPAACPAGWTDEGVVNQNSVNPNNQNGVTGVLHNNVGWMFYFERDYGCNSTSFAKVSVRRCSKTAAANGFV